MQKNRLKVPHGQTGILPVIVRTAFLIIRLDDTFPLELILIQRLYKVKELLHCTLEFRPIRRQIDQRYAQFSDLLEVSRLVLAALIRNQRCGKLMAVPILLRNTNAELSAPLSLIRDHIGQQTFQAIHTAFPRQGIPTAQSAVRIHTRSQDWPSNKTPSFVDKVDVADRGVQHPLTNTRRKLLNSISEQRTVVTLIALHAIPGDVIGLHVPVLAVEVPKLVDGRILRQQHP